MNCLLFHLPLGFYNPSSGAPPSKLGNTKVQLRLSKCDLREAGLKFNTCKRKQIQLFVLHLSEKKKNMLRGVALTGKLGEKNS